MITQKIDWQQYRAMVFAKIAEIVEQAHCSNYSILGYKYLDTKLILHYRDCDRVYLFEYRPIDEDHTNTDFDKQFSVTSFYTKDKTFEEYLDSVRKFEVAYKEPQPELQ